MIRACTIVRILRLAADIIEADERETPAPAPAAEPTPIYLHVATYAKRVSLGERTVWSLIAEGLPTIGVKRSRRVDVARADEWLAGQRAHVDDAIERQARAAATRAARGAR